MLLQAQAKESEYDAEKIADVFYALNGDTNNPHKKINHAKGFCAIGEFKPAKISPKSFKSPYSRKALSPHKSATP